jgi:hypothetical protein
MRVMFALVLAWSAACSVACSARAPSGPAWPRAADREIDGGESLAPRAAARTVAAVGGDERPADRAGAGTAADKTETAAVATAPAAGTATPGPGSPLDDPEIMEEIVIEVGD